MRKSVARAAFLINLIISIAFLYFIYMNMEITVKYICIFTGKMYEASFALMVVLAVAVGFVMGTLSTMVGYYRTNKSLNAYEKKHESLSVHSDEDKAKIKTLEAKIKTLESALDSALSDK